LSNLIWDFFFFLSGLLSAEMQDLFPKLKQNQSFLSKKDVKSSFAQQKWLYFLSPCTQQMLLLMDNMFWDYLERKY